jgi:hypothetical protein
MNEPKKRTRNQETRVKKSEVGSPESEDSATSDRHAPIEPKELQTENRPLTTEQMEVHHHPDLHHEKKPWKEYLLEGLMIFLAVTRAFLPRACASTLTRKAGHRTLP